MPAKASTITAAAASTFNNAGTFRTGRPAPTTVTVSVPFNNTGSVSVQAGKLSLTGGGADSGPDSFTVAASSTLGFDGGTTSLSASTSVSGAGAGEFGNGTTTFATGTTYDLTGGMTVDGGTVNFNAGASIQGIGTTLSLSSGAVNFSDGAAINVVTLNESSGLLTGSDTVTVSGLTTWTGGTMSGSGLTVANGGMTLSSSGGIELLNGRTLDNNAMANWTGNGNNIYLANAAVWNNGVNGVLDSQNAGQGINNNGGAASTFNNAGTFELTTGATTVTVSVPFNNTGSVSVQTGKLSLTGGGADSGPDSFTVAASSTLGFDGGTTSLSASTSVSGAGVGEFGNGTTTFATGMTYDLTGGMTVDGGTVNFNAGASVQGIGTTLSLSSGAVNFSDGAAINVVTLNESSGLLTGSDTVTVSGLTTWTGGTMSGSGLTVANGGMTISSGGGLELLNGRTLDNNAMANWTGNGNNIYLENAAVWNNGVNGVLDSQNAGQGIDNNGGAASAFDNAGTFELTTGATTVTVSVPFSNTGTVTVANGTLSLSSTFSNFNSGASSLTGGSYNITGAFKFTGANIVTNAANITLNGSAAAIDNLSSGANAFANLSTNNGALSLLGATATTAGALTNNGTLTLDGTLNVGGSYSQSSNASLDEQIGGAQAGQFGLLAVTGAATLAGGLGVAIINGYVPAQGASTSFLTAQSVAGSFSSVVNTVPGSIYAFSANYSAPTAVSIVVTAVPFTDLVVSQLQGPSQLVDGLQGPVSWTVTNQGNTATSAVWHDALYLSADGLIDANAVLLATAAEGSTSLGSNSSYTASPSFTVPIGTSPGSYWLIVDANYDQAQTESNYANNTRSVSVQVLPPQPDLLVTGLSTTPASGLQSGGNLTVNWNDSNSGLGAAATSFTDQVQVVNTTTGQTLATATVPYNESTLGPIAAGGSIAQQYSLQLPNGAAGAGQLQITVTNDINNQVVKFNSNGTTETSSTATVTATSSLASYPDLHATGVAIDPSSVLQSGGTVTVDWNDSNVGDGPASGNWYDNVAVVNTTTGQTLANANVTRSGSGGTLGAGQAEAHQYSFTLPNGTAGAGQLSIKVTADAGGSLLEYNQSGVIDTNRSASITGQSTLASYPDLATSNVVAPTTAVPGQQVTVNWTLSNAGTASAGGPWTEQVYVATDSAGNNETLLQSYQYAGPLAAGQSIPRTATVQLPNLAAGNYWIVVTENPFGQVYETNTANNTAVAAQSTAVAGALTLTLANLSVTDGAGAAATTATVTRNSSTSNSLVVTLSNSIVASVSAPQTVTIPAGQTSVTFAIGTINPGVVVGTQTATLTASAAGLASGSATLSVTDINVPTLTLALQSHSVNENAANPATTGTITRNTSTSAALAVSLVTSAMNKLSVPASVTIPAGQTSVTFPVTAMNDGMIDGNVTATVTAESAGFVAGADSAVVIDDNIPTLGLVLAQSSVSEAAGNDATIGTVSIASPATAPITIAMSSSDTAAATVPATVVIGAGQVSASFAIAAINNGLDIGNQTAVISANVETNAGIVVIQGAASANLLLLNANGPALSVSFANADVDKGATATATVTRNTSTTSSLTVNLSSSDTTKATVPVSVTIPAGQTAVSFTVTAIDDHIPDGLQQVQISASAGGFDTGIATLGITDVDLPDLVVSNVTAPASGYDNSPLPVSWTVTNNGQYPASGAWVDQVFLDPVGGPPSTTPADTVPFTGTVNAGQSYSNNATISFPSTIGQYIVRVVTDAADNIQELSFSNNAGVSQALNDQASYTATASTTASVFVNGTPIPISGVATLTSTGAPAAGVPVAVQVMVGGTTRTLTATTGPTGHYSITFQPLENEAGNYSVAAADPGVSNPPAQIQFQIVGMTAAPASANVQVVPNTPLTGQFTLTNLSGMALTGLTATASGGLAGLNVQLTAPTQIAGGGTATLAYSLDSTSTQAANGVVTINVTTTQGAVLTILMEVTVLPLTPSLSTSPSSLVSGMLVGGQTLVSFTVTNNGGAPSGELQVSLPSTSYLSLASPATIPSLAPGASSTVTLELSPPSTLPLAQYTGTLVLNSGLTGVAVPFTFTAVSSATGGVHVLVDDDYTFDEAGSPRVQGATVNLLNPYDNTQVVATGVTDATGAVTFNNVPAGPYDLQVQATGHSTYESNFTVVPGITNNDEIFVARQFVSYTWQVVQTTIQDTYQIQLQTEFQTNVPAPVVTISAPSTIPTLLPGQSGTFNVTITNHGLIAAQGVTLNLPTDPEYTFTALASLVGVVAADSSVVVPITVTRAAPKSLALTTGGTMLTATVVAPSSPVQANAAATLYVNYSNTGSVAIPAPILVLTATNGNSDGAFLSINPSLAGLAYNSNNTPAGFSHSVQILASGATPGIIEPGESESIPVYYAGWVSSEWDGSPVTFSLSDTSVDDSDPIKWDSMAPIVRPGSINVAAWNLITPILTNQLGSTWGQYVHVLDSDAEYLAGIGEPTNDLYALMSFEIEKANSAYTAQTLVSVPADNLPAPGLDLSFVQIFQPTIAGRNSQGILGLGWTTNWDISASTMTNGDVVIDDAGSSNYFSLQPNGSFAPESGDEGTTLTGNNGAYQLTGPAGTIYQFNTDGTLNYVQDKNGNRITAAYNAEGQLDSLTQSNGEYVDLSYNAQGHLSQLTDSSGQTDTYGYDPTGQYLISFTGVNGTTNYTYVTGSSSAAQNNCLAEIAYSNNTQIDYTYDAQGRLIDQHDNGGADDEAITYLNPGGYITTDGDGNKTTTYFNLFGAPAETIDPLGNTTRNFYDSNLNLTKVVQPGGATYTYTYDADGNLTSQTDPLLLTTHFTYNSNNYLTGFTDPKGSTTSYAYNSTDNLLSITYANSAAQQYTYNPLGEATQFVNANGQTIGLTYNADGLVTQATFTGGAVYSYTYNAQGNLTSATDAQANVTTFVYGISSNPNLLTEVEYPNGTWLKFSYNTVGERTQSVDQTGFTVNYIYDALGRLSQLTNGGGGLIVQYVYDNANNLIQKNNGNGTFTVYAYDGDKRVLSITNYAPSSGGTSYVAANSAVNSFDHYTYDALGNVLTDTNQDGQWVYTYDADSQLTGAVFTPNSADPDGLTAQNLQYVYDADGNRVSEMVNGVTTSYVVNNVDEYTSSTTNGVATAFQYDADGNLIAQTTGGSTTSYTYNPLNELTAVNGPGQSASYTYDPLGNLVAQSVNGAASSFQVDPTGLGNGVAVFGAGGALTSHYVYGLGLVSQVNAAGVADFYDFNNVGSTVGITGTTGSYVDKYAYLPFGQSTAIAAAVSNPFTYIGQSGVSADGSGLFDMRFRNYNPVTGAFISNDPFGLAGGDSNIRRYAGNNPTLRIDPIGLCSISFGPQGGFGIGGGLQYSINDDGSTYLTGSLGLTTPGVTLASASTSSASAGLSGAASYGVGDIVSAGGSVDWDGNFSKSVSAGFSSGGWSLMFSYTKQLSGPDPSRAFPCPPDDLPTPSPGPCTLDLTGSSFYVCDNNDVTSQFNAPIGVPGRACDAQAVSNALSAINTSSVHGPVGGSTGNNPLVAGGGGSAAVGTSSSANCNPQLNNIDQLANQAASAASGSGPGGPPPGPGSSSGAYVGFTGGTGVAASTQEILNWTYASGSTTLNYSGGFASNPFQLNGGAAISGTALELTDGNGNEARSAFYPTAVSVAGFTSGFQFTYLANNAANGLTFAIQNTGPTALGGDGAQLGYGGIGNSVAVELNVYNNVSQLGVGANGAINLTTDLTAYGINFHTNPTDTYQATVTYNGSGAIAVTITDTNSGATTGVLTFSASVPASTGGSGFSMITAAGVGGSTSGGGPPINSAPPVAGTHALLSSSNVTSSPITFLGTALGNLGLIVGQSANDGYTPAQSLQMAPTIATFEQTEADLAAIFTTAAGNGASLGITGDLNLLQTIDTRLEAVTVAENLLFGGDANWLNTTQPATLQQWLTTFFADVQSSSNGTISAAATAQLLATTLPGNLSIAEATEFLNRWNRTVQYWGQGIYMANQVPAGQSTDFIDVGALQSAFNAALTAEQESQVDGFSDVGAEVQADIAEVQNDLSKQGVCATVKLQIDQTATLTRSAFSGTLSLTNSEAAGALSNVVMNINITDTLGNPANGEFVISSPTYSGSFSVVNGSATLPDNSTGSISFTFIPDDTAAPNAPVLYEIGGTISFIDPAGGAVSIPVFPATITVEPQAELQVNYFLQQTVIGEDPFTPNVVILSEPAVLGMLVTNVGAGAANNLSITTAQPTIVQNEKGLLDTIQIVGTQVGTQQETPSLQVDLGNIQPGQTADADFLLTSTLQGAFTDFTASFSHSNALGGLETSLISSVNTHTLIHAGNFNFSGSTGEIDYLAEDNPNINNFPDTIYFSNGTTAAVNIATNASSSPAHAPNTYTVTASMTSGWDYIELPDPGAGFTLSSVVRSDGTVIPVSDQAWTTDRTITDTGKSSVDFELHILDFNSTGSYTVTYVPATIATPTSSVAPLPAFSPPSFNVSWAGSGGSGALNYTIYVSDNGGPFTPWLTDDSQTSAIYPGVNGHTYAFYSVAADSVGDTQSTPPGAQATTAVAVPVVTGISPTSGPSTGGTTITITGMYFMNVTAVDFGSQPAMSFTVNSTTQITAVTPDPNPGLADVTVVTIAGTSATSNADQFNSIAYPTVAITAPAPGSFTNKNGPTLTASASETGGSGLASVQIQYSANGGAAWMNAGAVQTVGPFGFTFTSFLADGAYEVRAIALDNAGHSTTSAVVSFTIDTTPPVVSITSKPPTTSNSSSATFSFTGSDPTSGGVSSGVSYFQYELDSGGYQTATSPVNLTGLSNASHTFQVEDVDNAGNVSAPASYTWTVDAPPSLSGLPVVNGTSAVINIVSATGNGTTATITTGTPHGFWVGELVKLTGTTPGGPGGLAGTVTVTGVPAATSFQFASTYSGSESLGSATVTAALAGAQRSMVDSIVYNFTEPVTLTAAAFSISAVVNNTTTGSDLGIAPTLNVAAVPFTNEWVVTFTDPTNGSVIGHSIANGAYSISINPALVTAVSDGQKLAAAETDTFYRLYGDVSGAQSVLNVDANAFNRTWANSYYSAAYNAALDYNDAGKFTNIDANAFNRAFNARYNVATTI